MTTQEMLNSCPANNHNCSCPAHLGSDKKIATFPDSRLNAGVRDPRHFGTDPDPQTRTSDERIRMRIREAKKHTRPGTLVQRVVDYYIR
jgi:hypothetical protein